MGKWIPANHNGLNTQDHPDGDHPEKMLKALGMDLDDLSAFAHARFQVFKEAMLQNPSDMLNEDKWCTFYMAGFIEGGTNVKERMDNAIQIVEEKLKERLQDRIREAQKQGE